MTELSYHDLPLKDERRLFAWDELRKRFPREELPEIVWDIAATEDEPFADPLDIDASITAEVLAFIAGVSDVPSGSNRLGEYKRELIAALAELEGQSDPEPPTVEEAPASDVNAPSLEWGRGGPGMPGPGLQSRRRWTIELYACKSIPAGATALGAAVIEPHVSVDNGEFWLSLDRMSELTGQAKSGLGDKRTELVRGGWLVDTGNRKGNGTVVYRIVIPSGCEKCGPHDRTQSIPPRVV